LRGSAAPGLPGLVKDNRSGNHCQMHKGLEKSIGLLFSIKLSYTDTVTKEVGFREIEKEMSFL